MPYSNSISTLDLSGGVPDVRVSAGYSFSTVGGPGARAQEHLQDEVTLDIASASFQPGPHTFSYAGDLAPVPNPTWYIAMWIQEVPRIPQGTGWLFRSGRFTTEPPSDPLEVIVAPEVFITQGDLDGAFGPLPSTQGSTTISTVELMINGADVDIHATGTDTQLPAGVTFDYRATLVLIPNGSLVRTDQPFDVDLRNPNLTFVAGSGTGFVTALLNVIAGWISNEVTPRLEGAIRTSLNASVLTSIATRLNKGVPAAWPADVVLSVRSVRGLTQGTTPVIGVRTSLGAFGGVLSKFPALSSGSGSRCFIATAAAGADSPEVSELRAFRDDWLRHRPGGEQVISVYERVSPPLARRIEGRDGTRRLVRTVLVTPAAALARRMPRRR